ncbi:MAG: pentapeptide repeat-containing protein [Armatimonadia bacterium]
MAARRPLCFLLPAVAVLFATAVFAAPTASDLTAALDAGKARGADFAGLQAPGLALRNADLSGTNLQKSDLRGSSLAGVNLTGANLFQSTLRGAVLSSVNLTEANLADVDLSGAILQNINLDGASLAAARLDGTRFEAPLLTATGAPHLTALRLALQQAPGTQFTRAQVAAFSGDAFTFVYNTQDPAFWPGTPFCYGPLMTAPAVLGLEAKLRTDYTAEHYLIDDKEAARGIHMLALRLTAPEQRALLSGPVWVLLSGRQPTDKHTYFTLTAPLFGTLIMRRDELVTAWSDPVDLLQPVAGAATGKKPLLTITPKAELPPLEDQVKVVTRQAVAMITDKRTYGPLVPGEAGWLKLAADLNAAAQTGDWEAARRLAAWQDFPRQCVLGSTTLAAEYLAQAAASLPPALSLPLTDAAAQYQMQATLLASWPLLDAAETAPAGWQDKLNRAAELAAGMAATDRKIAVLLAPVAQ